MNRLELEEEIKEEGLTRGIRITKCNIYDRSDYLEFYPEIENNHAEAWVYPHQVEELISNLAPLERPHKINKIDLDESRYNLFDIGDKIEINNVWIRLNAGENEPKKLIKITACCGQYRQGWVKGEVFETPKQNDRVLGIKFNRDIYIESEKCGWIGDVTNLEQLINEGKIKKIEVGQPIWSGTHRWDIRKP